MSKKAIGALNVGAGPWRSGPPPSVGWWPADMAEDRRNYLLRWWNGKWWSVGISFKANAAFAADAARVRSIFNRRGRILWRQRAAWWPERSKT